MNQLFTLPILENRQDNPYAFEVMLAKSQDLHKAGFFEFAIIQCHITMDYFINAILETNFMPKLHSLRDQDPDIHKLFLKAIWETDEERKYLSFTKKFGKYVSALGFEFAGYTAKGGRKFYKELEKLNTLRNGIVHNRYFGSNVTSDDVLENIQLCRDVITLFLNRFNTSSDFSSLGPYSAYFYKENDLVVRVQEIGSNRIEKITDLYYDVGLTFFSTEHSGVNVPSELTDLKHEFRSFALQVCVLDYVRYGVDKIEKSSPLCPFEPQWQNGNLFAMKVNLNFYEIARDFESILAQKEASIKGLIAKLITEKYEQMLQSWECLDFVDQVSLSRLFTHLFNLSDADPFDPTSTLSHILGNVWNVVVITGTDQIAFMSLNDVSKLEDRRFVLTERSNPAEISLLARAAHKLGFLDENIVIVLPDSQPRQAYLDFVKKFLSMNGAECAGEEAMKRLAKEISLKHKDRKLSKYSDYALVATDCNFLDYIAEIINGRPHINGDHWFSKKILSLMWALPKEYGAEILYLIENINETLEGRSKSFTDINNFRDKLREILIETGMVSENEELLRIEAHDFPPGFFTWKKIFMGTDELISR